jgi:glycosyltransferase involved in cell wall biosynthesis
MPKLKCLMPTFNKDKILSKAIESVLSQKTNFEYELLILDDASTDKSFEIAQSYESRFPSQVKILRNDRNLKYLKTMTKGYSHLADAEYFCILDADDYYTYDKKYADAIEFLDKNREFTMYAANALVLIDGNGYSYPYYEGKIECLDFNYEDRKKGNYVFIQTASTIYRNVYFRQGLNRDFERALSFKYSEVFSGDSFRNEWHIRAGKCHFVNHIESVYNYNHQGIWSSLSELEQSLLNAQLCYSLAVFFDDEFYVKPAFLFYEKAFEIIQESNGETPYEIAVSLSLLELGKELQGFRASVFSLPMVAPPLPDYRHDFPAVFSSQRPGQGLEADSWTRAAAQRLAVDCPDILALPDLNALNPLQAWAVWQHLQKLCKAPRILELGQGPWAAPLAVMTQALGGTFWSLGLEQQEAKVLEWRLRYAGKIQNVNLGVISTELNGEYGQHPDLSVLKETDFDLIWVSVALVFSNPAHAIHALPVVADRLATPSSFILETDDLALQQQAAVNWNQLAGDGLDLIGGGFHGVGLLVDVLDQQNGPKTVQ